MTKEMLSQVQAV